MSVISFEAVQHMHLNAQKVLAKTSKRIYLCGYKIDSTHLIPFLSYLLKSEEENDNRNGNQLILPYYDLPKEIIIRNNDELLSLMDINLKLLLRDVKCLFDNVKYQGYMVYNKHIYMFYDFSQSNINIITDKQNSPFWFGLVDEIANQKQICDIPINSSVVTDFFLTNSSFLILKDNMGISYDTPVVAYMGAEHKLVNYTYVFGVKKSLLGGYFFTNYNNAVKENNAAGIIRFALFMLNTKVEISQVVNKNWITRYDSVIFTGVRGGENEEKEKEGVIFGVSEYEQQVPLSYHYI